MAQPQHQDQGGDQGLGFERGTSPEIMAEKTFFLLANSVLSAVDFDEPIQPGGLRYISEVKLPGKPPRLLGSNQQYGNPMFYVGSQKLDQPTAQAAHKEGLADFLTSEAMIAEGKPMGDEERVLGTWVLMGNRAIRATDLTFQHTRLEVHVYWHRSKRTAEHYARADFRRMLPTGQAAVQRVAVRVRREYSRGYEDGPHNTAELGRYVDGGFRGGSEFTSLEIYDDVFRPRVPLGRLGLSTWQDVIEAPLVENDILRLRKDT